MSAHRPPAPHPQSGRTAPPNCHLTRDEVLAEIGLIPQQAPSAGSPALPGPGLSVRCGRPLVYPAIADDLPSLVRQRGQSGATRYHGMLLAFDLGHLPPGHCYTAARFAVSLADRRVTAVGLECDTALPPNSTQHVSRRRASWLQRLRFPAARRATVSGIRNSSFGWSYDAAGGALEMRSFTMHAFLESPPDATELEGVMSVEADVLRKSHDQPRLQITAKSGAISFTESLASESDQNLPVRLLAAIGSCEQRHAPRLTAEQSRLQTAIVLERALDQTSVNESRIESWHEEWLRFIALPAGASDPRVIRTFIQGLQKALQEVNSDPGGKRIQLHVSLYLGVAGARRAAAQPVLPFDPAASCEVAAKALADHPEADLALVMSNDLHLNVMMIADPLPDADALIWAGPKLPAPGDAGPGWLYMLRPG